MWETREMIIWAEGTSEPVMVTVPDRALVIVESAAKCATISKILGGGYSVMASLGHVRALAKSLDAIGLKRDFEPKFEVIDRAQAIVTKLRRELSAYNGKCILASDDDPEGEAIAWHICFCLKLPIETTPRIVFHAITAGEINAAMAAPRVIDMARVESQQARAMLDMLIGFTISPLLMGTFGEKSLSAGRCQTPALRLLCEREDQIEAFEGGSRFQFRAVWAIGDQAEGAIIDSVICTPEEAGADYESAKEFMGMWQENPGANIGSFGGGVVDNITNRTGQIAAPAPFITATLQQYASSRHGMTPAVTNALAQSLYNAGHITYIRTDSTAISPEAQAACAAWIKENHGEEYSVPRNWGENGRGGDKRGDEHRRGKKARGRGGRGSGIGGDGGRGSGPVHAAHEAIRPTHVDVLMLNGRPEGEQKLYEIIWKRAMQSQMANAEMSYRKITIVTENPASAWSAGFEHLDFPGWRILEAGVTGGADDDVADQSISGAVAKANANYKATAGIAKGTQVECRAISAEEIFESPPARYTEAMLISELKSRGIGRPATFANIVDTVLKRTYAVRESRPGHKIKVRYLELIATVSEVGKTRGKTKTGGGMATIKENSKLITTGAAKNKLFITEMGRRVHDYLMDKFADIFDYGYTATMNAGLDEIAEGREEWKGILKRAWGDLEPRVTLQKGVLAGERRLTNQARKMGEVLPDTEKRRFLGEGVYILSTRFGLRFLRETAAVTAMETTAVTVATETTEGSGENDIKKEFAEAGVGITFATATLANAIAAFNLKTAANGPWGSWNGEAIQLKKGPFGWYLQAGDVRAKAPNGDKTTAGEAMTAIEVKAAEFKRELGGGISIRKNGDKGFFIMQASVTKGGKPEFRSLPDGSDPATITIEECIAELEKPRQKPAGRGNGGFRGRDRDRGRGRGRGRG